MRAGLRFGIAAAAAALAFGQAQALAQEAPPANAAETVGPRELENFSLNGTVTRPAPPAEEPRAAPETRPPGRPAPTQVPATTEQTTPATTVPGRPPAISQPRQAESTPPVSGGGPVTVPGPATLPVGDSITLPLPPPSATAPREPSSTPESASSEPDPAAGSALKSLPWVLALLLLGGAVAYFFLHRQRGHEEFALAGAPAEALAPSPSPAPPTGAPPPPPRPSAATARGSVAAPPQAPPRPAPVQRATQPTPGPAADVLTRAPAPAAPAGVVSTRLRPWIDIRFEPLRCMIEDQRVAIEFAIALYNSGSIPARDVLVEAAMINAGPTQDQEIAQFFANPVAEGERIPAIAPLKQFTIRNAVSLTRDQLRQFEAKGRRFFVPLIAFNAIYGWGNSQGQTSVSYLIGRGGNGERMAPLRLDLGTRLFQGLGAREHDLRVRK